MSKSGDYTTSNIVIRNEILFQSGKYSPGEFNMSTVSSRGLVAGSTTAQLMSLYAF